MEKGCKNHRKTLYSSKRKIVYVVGKPCNIYRLRGNPIVIIGFSPQWFKPWFNSFNSSIIYCGCQKIMSVSRLLVIYNSGYVLPFPYTYVHKCLPHLQPFGCLVVPSNNGSAMFCFLLLISDKAKHCRTERRNDQEIADILPFPYKCLLHLQFFTRLVVPSNNVLLSLTEI